MAALNASIDELTSKYAYIDRLSADDVKALNIECEKLRSQYIETGKLDAQDLDAVRAKIDNLVAKNAEFGYVTAERFNALKANIDTLDVRFAEIDFANIDFTEIDIAKINELFLKSGILDSIVTAEGTITGTLVGVTIKGDLIEGGTIVADKLVVKGSNGLYYKLNTEAFKNGDTESTVVYKEIGTIGPPPVDGELISGVTTDNGRSVYCYSENDVMKYYAIDDEIAAWYEVSAETTSVVLEPTDYNSLNGSIIAAKSIAATKIDVTDLVAFGATIGGFKITDNSIHSIGKTQVESPTAGIYMDDHGQLSLGDDENYLKCTRTVNYIESDIVLEVSDGIIIEGATTDRDSLVYSITDPELGTKYYAVRDGVKYEVVEDVKYRLAISASDILYAIKDTKYSLADLAGIGKYVRIGVYTPEEGESEPCIELGDSENANNFKLIITNTRILFMEGSTNPAYITNESLHIKKAVVEDELRFGQFVWQGRENGNMGVVWVDNVEEASM